MNNLLITADFDIRLIDHSRAFRSFSGLQDPDQLVRFSRTLVGHLERLTFEQLKPEVGRYLSDARIERLLDRRDAILELVKVRVAARGESAVFYR